MNSRERQLNAFENPANIICFSNTAKKEFLTLTFQEPHLYSAELISCQEKLLKYLWDNWKYTRVILSQNCVRLSDNALDIFFPKIYLIKSSINMKWSYGLLKSEVLLIDFYSEKVHFYNSARGYLQFLE